MDSKGRHSRPVGPDPRAQNSLDRKKYKNLGAGSLRPTPVRRGSLESVNSDTCSMSSPSQGTVTSWNLACRRFKWVSVSLKMNQFFTTVGIWNQTIWNPETFDYKILKIEFQMVRFSKSWAIAMVWTFQNQIIQNQEFFFQILNGFDKLLPFVQISKFSFPISEVEKQPLFN